MPAAMAFARGADWPGLKKRLGCLVGDKLALDEHGWHPAVPEHLEVVLLIPSVVMGGE
jgi:hypothetical protein